MVAVSLGVVPAGCSLLLVPETLSAVLDGHGLRAVEDRAQRHASKGHEVVQHGPAERLRRLVADDGDLDHPRPLQPRAEEVDPLLPPVEVGHHELAEVVLGELAGEALEAHLELGAPGPALGDQGVERRLLPGVPLQRRAAEDLLGREFRVVCEDATDQRLDRFGEAGPTDLAALALGVVVDVVHGILLRDPADRASGGAGVLGHLGLGVAGGEENLDGMALEKWEHPAIMAPPPPP